MLVSETSGSSSSHWATIFKETSQLDGGAWGVGGGQGGGERVEVRPRRLASGRTESRTLIATDDLISY